MQTFPAFFPLTARHVVIAGDGEGAAAKGRLFAGSPARVTFVAPRAALDEAAYADADLIFIASHDAAWVAAAAAAARRSGSRAPMNVVDHPELSDFHTPAIIDRGQVVAAIGSAGAAPLLASLLRAEIEARVPMSAGTIAALLGARRDALREAFPDLPQRRSFLRAVLAGPAAAAAEAGDLELAEERLDAAIAGGWSGLGWVTFVDAPAAADLISVRSVRSLNIADILVAGDGSEAIIATHGRRDAERWTWANAEVAGLATQALAGRLIAVVGAGAPPGLAADLGALGVDVRRHASAPDA